MLAKANKPSGVCSCSRLLRFSFVMTREMNDELLFDMLFFGFDLLFELLVAGFSSDGFPSPKAGADDFRYFKLPLEDVPPVSLLISTDGRPSFGCSCMAPMRISGMNLEKNGVALRVLRESSETLVPAVAG